MKLILTHSNADFDAIAAALAASKLYPDHVPVIPDRLNRNVYSFMTLYRNGLPFINENEIRPDEVDGIILVDTQRLPKIKNLKDTVPQRIIDHHQPFQQTDTISSEPVGAATTLLVEQLQVSSLLSLSSIEATLLALGIYEDTGSLSYGTTTPRDIRAAAWLLEQNAVLDTVRRFLNPPLTDEQQVLIEQLLKVAQSEIIHGYTVTVAATTVDHYVEQVASIAHRLRDTLDPSALFVIVQMPQNTLLVCRATDDALDVGVIAQAFGGGGHNRAAAATIYDRPLQTIITELWEYIHTNIKPMTTVQDLMSYGVQTVESHQQVKNVVQHLRRIGHEGFPVVEKDSVIGLLTRREIDRAIEHGLGDLTIREIMSSGEFSLHPTDSVLLLEQKMVESGWGQIPIVDERDHLIGIVTRTDLIKHWANTHPQKPASEPSLSLAEITTVMGEPIRKLIDMVIEEAERTQVNLYLVGGVVRDLLLKRPNFDIDFVVENNAIELAQNLQNRWGGEVHTHQPFGTARWIFTDATAQALGVKLADLPQNLDFATARNEFYEHPTALPTIYRSSIKLDLQRRDFTINTLAIQLTPVTISGRVLDFYGGQSDLQAKLIRVLHSLSFVDDPTRILRALRFQRRLGFSIEARTAELMGSALPMLRRITGERLRNELDLLLKEPDPDKALHELQSRGVLQAIHPAFVFEGDLTKNFQAVRQLDLPWQPDSVPDQLERFWHVLASAMKPSTAIEVVCERLLISRRTAASLLDTAQIIQEPFLNQTQLPASQIVEYLENRSETALGIAWCIPPSQQAKGYIEQFMTTWRHIQPTTTGYTLREMGLPPGPCYRLILNRLRTARLNNEITDDAAEQNLLNHLIHDEDICHDHT